MLHCISLGSSSTPADTSLKSTTGTSAETDVKSTTSKATDTKLPLKVRCQRVECSMMFGIQKGNENPKIIQI